MHSMASNRYVNLEETEVVDFVTLSGNNRIKY